MRHIIVITAILLYCEGVFALSADAVVGVWRTPEDKSKIEIYSCEKRYCGRIIWLQEPNYPPGDAEAGAAKRDRENPRVALRKRTLQGLELMTGFAFDGDEAWVDGRIYDPESGKTYDCKMTLENSQTLKVRGYIGFSLLGRTSIWTRDH